MCYKASTKTGCCMYDVTRISHARCHLAQHASSHHHSYDTPCALAVSQIKLWCRKNLSKPKNSQKELRSMAADSNDINEQQKVLSGIAILKCKTYPNNIYPIPTARPFLCINSWKDNRKINTIRTVNSEALRQKHIERVRWLWGAESCMGRIFYDAPWIQQTEGSKGCSQTAQKLSNRQARVPRVCAEGGVAKFQWT